MHPVVGGHAHRRPAGRGIELVDRGRDPSRRGEHRGHGTVLFQRTHEHAAGGREPQAVLEAEHAGGPGGRDLPEAVADDHVGPDADARPERRQSALDRIDAGLRPGRIVQVFRCLAGTEHDIEHGDAALGAQHFVAAVEDGPEDRLRVVEGAAHAHPLAGLARVGEGNLGAGSSRRRLVAFRQ